MFFPTKSAIHSSQREWVWLSDRLHIGAHPKVVQELLEYSRIAMTLDIYSHVLPSMQGEIMDKLNELFQ